MVELLAPAQNKECAISAIKYGADAVYIGASAFGARKNASNSLQDIEQVVEYAHKFYSKVYTTVNTILRDDELEAAQKLICNLYDIGVDALIVQDMGLLELDLPPIPLHASTQCDNSSVEKIKFLEETGFKRVVLAREMSLARIEEIKKATNVELEVFIHGALCVSYSGQCYLSYANGGRSANRGECAQPCRKKYSLYSEDRKKFIEKDKYLLSLRDFNASEHIKELVDIGVTSFKIEGRLKDADYVKNVVAYYRKKLDAIGAKGSSGKVFYDFEPNVSKSFNRGFCEYFLCGRKNCANFLTPKSLGEEVGTVESAFKSGFVLKGEKINPQDGLCFFENDELTGFLVNKVEGNKIFPNKNVQIKKGTKLYRNFDFEFQKKLENSKTTRKIGVKFFVDGGKISVLDEDKNSAELLIDTAELAKDAEKMREMYIKQLSKSGESDFFVEGVEFSNSCELKFMKISEINSVRRELLELLSAERTKNYKRIKQGEIKVVKAPWSELDFRANVLNEKAKAFYEKRGCKITEYALEKGGRVSNRPLMRTKHCLKFAFGLCGDKEKLVLIDEKGKKYKLEFDCKNCQMSIIGGDSDE